MGRAALLHLTPGNNGLPRLFQALLQSLPRQVIDDGTEHRSHAERNLTRQRDRFASNVNPAVSLFKEPVAIHAPQITAVLSDRQFMLIWTARGHHFVDPFALGAAVRSLAIDVNKLDRLLRVENVGEHKLGFHHSHENQEVIALPG